MPGRDQSTFLGRDDYENSTFMAKRLKNEQQIGGEGERRIICIRRRYGSLKKTYNGTHTSVLNMS